jgi:hypothetical protein
MSSRKLIRDRRPLGVIDYHHLHRVLAILQPQPSCS